MLNEPRIKPLLETDANSEQMKFLDSLRRRDGKVMNVYRTLARHPKMGERWLKFAGYVLRESSLPQRDREILILRIGWLCRAEYEFGQHTILGKKAGLTAEEIKRITLGPTETGWDSWESTLIRAVDELHSNAFITETTWDELSKKYSREQLMDVIMTVGNYNLVSMLLNSLGVQLDPEVPGFPK